MKKFILSLDIYPFDLWFLLGSDRQLANEQLRIFLQGEEYNEIPGEWVGFVSGLHQNRLFIWIKRKDPLIISHEIFHVVHKIMDAIGQTLTDDSQESYAYLTGFLNQEVYRAWNSKPVSKA